MKDSRRKRKPIKRPHELPELLANLSPEDLVALVTELVQPQPELDDQIRAAISRPPALQKKKKFLPEADLAKSFGT